jgi:hypothetical protein
MAKLYASEIAVKAADDCVDPRRLRARGTTPLKASRCEADDDRRRYFSEIHRLVIARQLLTR